MELTKYKVCPECGKHNPPSLLECRYCEADLTGVMVADGASEQEAEAAGPCGITEEKTLVRICECGVENPPQARKCQACGEDISDIVPVEKGQARPFTYALRSLDGGFSVTMDKPLCVIGREADLRDRLADKVYVSRQHARLTVVAEKVFIENLSQTNRTFVNSEKIPSGVPVALRDGDEIGLGGKVIDGARQEQAAYFIFEEQA